MHSDKMRPPFSLQRVSLSLVCVVCCTSCTQCIQTAWQLRVTSRDNGHILGLVYIAASFMWQRGFCYLLG